MRSGGGNFSACLDGIHTLAMEDWMDWHIWRRMADALIAAPAFLFVQGYVVLTFATPGQSGVTNSVLPTLLGCIPFDLLLCFASVAHWTKCCCQPDWCPEESSQIRSACVLHHAETTQKSAATKKLYCSSDVAAGSRQGFTRRPSLKTHGQQLLQRRLRRLRG